MRDVDKVNDNLSEGGMAENSARRENKEGSKSKKLL